MTGGLETQVVRVAIFTSSFFPKFFFLLTGGLSDALTR
jgi:hypothetical protein